MAANPLHVPRQTLELETHQSPEETMVLCHGRIIAETTNKLREEVKVLVPYTKRLVLDLSDVAYMDSAGLGALVGIYISAKRAGCELKLINLSDRVMELLRITKVASVFNEYGGYL